MAKRWSKAEEQALRDCIGSYGWGKVKRVVGESYPNFPWFKFGRSKAAIKLKILRMGICGVKRGAYSINAIIKTTGYELTAIKRAQVALNQKWRRLGPKGVFIITEEQYDDLMAWLKHDYWCVSKRLYGCVCCATKKENHLCAGLCSSCFNDYRRHCYRLELPNSLSKQLRLATRLPTRSPQRREIMKRLSFKITLATPQLVWLSKAVHKK